MKERILRKNFKNKNEMERYLYTKSWNRAVIVAGIVMGILSIIRVVRGENIFDVSAIVTSGTSIHHYFMFFHFEKSLKYLIPAIFSNVAFVICVMAFLVK